jgi:hypothetical protein
MRRAALTRNIIAGAAIALAFAVIAQAQNNRSFVATTGDDANDCSAGAYCRTFVRALAVTNSGGEIVVVDSGGYGPATITQPVVITAIGVDASITGESGTALTINTTGNVTITGLNLYGSGVGSNVGIAVEQVGFLRLYSVQIVNFDNGVDATAKLAMYDSKITDCSIGLFADTSARPTYITRPSITTQIWARTSE